MSYNLFISETEAIQVEMSVMSGAMYTVGDKYMWIPDGVQKPYGAAQYSSSYKLNVAHVRIWHNDLADDKSCIVNFAADYGNTVKQLWAIDHIHYGDYVVISGVTFNTYADMYIPDTAVLQGLYPRGYNPGGRASIKMTEWIVDKDEMYDEFGSFDTSAVPYNTAGIHDPFDNIVGLTARRAGNYISVTIDTPDANAFVTKYNRGYACYKVIEYIMDGNVDTSNTIDGVAVRRKVRESKQMVSLDDVLASRSLTFDINPFIKDSSISDVVIEMSAAFWHDDYTSLENMHTGVVSPDAIYISRDAASLSDKIPLQNGFYDITWNDGIVVYAGRASYFMNTQKFSHVPGPSTLKVYNCVKVSDQDSASNNKSGYTLFKIQANRDTVVSAPTSIIVPYYDVICTVGVAAIETLENQQDTQSNDLWNSQK